jgi:hypothetical protein
VEAAKYLANHVIAPGRHVPFGPCVDAMERARGEALQISNVVNVARRHRPTVQ